MPARAITRRLQKFSLYSTCLILPKHMVSELGWQPGDVVRVRQTPTGQILVQKNTLTPTVEETAIPILVHPSQTIQKTTREEDVLPIPELR